jgi:GDP-L-fucose synthase
MNQGKDVPDFVNVGTGEDIEIREVAQMIAYKMGFKGKLIFDNSKPDGTMKKLLDVSRIQNIGWKHHIQLNEGLDLAIKYYYTP